MTDRETMDGALAPTADAAWVIVEDGFDPLRQTSRESRFTISNGFLGVRGAEAITRGAGWVVPPRTYVAGLFDTPDIAPTTARLVPAADWLRVNIQWPDGPPRVGPGGLSSHRATLDIARGAVLGDSRQPRETGFGIGLRSLRLVSMAQRAIGLQLIQLELETGDVEIALEAGFEGAGLGLIAERLDQDLGVWRTLHSGKTLAMATAASLWVDGQSLDPATTGPFSWTWRWTSRTGQRVSFQRFVAITRGDQAGQHTAAATRAGLDAAKQLGWRGVVAAHEAAWTDRWRSSDVVVEGDPSAQQALRFALYHLNSAANPDDGQVSIGARGLTGDDYLGHVFWDTDIFMMPFYSLTWPEAARALLMYRFHTLGGARAKALRLGWRGALYAWESADTGAETTPEQVVGPDRRVVDVLSGRQEQHISADVAYAVWQYWLATGDEGFLLDAGAEILLETARFWSSRASLEPDGLRHIRGVMGPDEYHENVDDNAFTNGMARWNIRRALETASLLRERWPRRWASLSGRLGLDDAELHQWRDVADTLATGLDPETGLFEQFAGYFGLKQIDLAAYAGRSVPMDVVLGRERTATTQVVKQADVVALLALLPDAFAGPSGAANFRYYEPRCSHGSSLSSSLHGLAAARLGDGDTALRYFRQTAAIDLADTHVAIGGGVHMAAQGGLWQTAVLGFAGLSLLADGLALAPRLPAGWLSLSFAVQWRGRHLKIRIDQTGPSAEVTLEAGAPMTMVINGAPHALGRDLPLRVFAASPPTQSGGAA
jgi:trehalose/maltose hydrolase-like predicted phosphorylase